MIVTRSGEAANPFCWEIKRRRQAMGVKVFGSGYRSYRAAREAGGEALEKFLDDLAKVNETSR